jgi:Mg/Co/Ni transporter MgtE
MIPKVLSVRSDNDQEEVANMFRKYDLNVLPVVNRNGVLIGIIIHLPEILLSVIYTRRQWSYYVDEGIPWRATVKSRKQK